MLSAAATDYLETIYNVTVEGEPVVGARLAEKFGVSAASVAEMLKRLERDGYLRLGRPRGPQLTEKGIEVAEQSLRSHRLAERFLFDVLGMDWITAHEQAHALQHAMTPILERHIVAAIGEATTCPHGNPIPGSAPNTREFLQRHGAERLSALPAGAAAEVLCISEVVEDESALLAYLGQTAITPGARVVVVEPASGVVPCLLELDGVRVAIGGEVASKIWVCRQNRLPSADRQRELVEEI